MPRSSAEMTKLQRATGEYLHELEAKGTGATTVQRRAWLLENFTQFLWENGYTIQGPTFTAVQSWRDEMQRSRSQVTVRQYLVELRAFFSWASDPDRLEARYYDQNPVSKRLFPADKIVQRPYSTILTDEQAAKLWRNERPKTAKASLWPRNYAIVVMLMSTNMRKGELLDLRPCDLDWETREIRIEHGKGDKFRAIDFPDIAQVAVKLYLASGERPDGLLDTDPLFGTKTKDGGIRSASGTWSRGTSQWLGYVVRTHVKAVTGADGIGPHDLRHEGATLDLHNGMSMEELQNKLGHASLPTTQIYCGRLKPGRARASAKRVYQERDIQAKRNYELLGQMHMESA